MCQSKLLVITEMSSRSSYSPLCIVTRLLSCPASLGFLVFINFHYNCLCYSLLCSTCTWQCNVPGCLPEIQMPARLVQTSPPDTGNAIMFTVMRHFATKLRLCDFQDDSLHMEARTASTLGLKTTGIF